MRTLPYFIFCFVAANFASAQELDRPNFLLIVLDDFGTGQFAPNAAELNEGDMDPNLIEYVIRQKGIRKYKSSEALKAARRAMPTLSQLATSGLNATQAFSSSALCSPSRCGLVSAIHPNRFGIYNNVDVSSSPVAMRPERILMPYFQKAGYATGHIGKWHLGPHDDRISKPILEKHGIPLKTYIHGIPKKSPAGKDLVESGYFGSIVPELHPLKNGYDYYYGYNYHQSNFYGAHNVWDGYNHAGLQNGYNTETFTQKAVDFIESAHKGEKPFFLSLNYHAVHGPLFPYPPKKYMKPFEGMTGVLKNFYGHVHAVDENIRHIVEALKAMGIYGNTCIIFTSDNGAAVSRDNTLPGNAPHRGQKGQYTQGGIKVPMLLSWPDRILKGRETSELMSHLDIMPTLMDAAGIPPVKDLDGKSLLAFIDGAKEGPHDHLIWFGLQSVSWGFECERSHTGESVRNHEPGSWIIRTRDRLLRYTGTLKPGLYKDLDQGHQPLFELYDTTSDPGEKHNLYHQKPELARNLMKPVMDRSTVILPPLHWRRPAWKELMESLK